MPKAASSRSSSPTKAGRSSSPVKPGRSSSPTKSSTTKSHHRKIPGLTQIPFASDLRPRPNFPRPPPTSTNSGNPSKAKQCPVEIYDRFYDNTPAREHGEGKQIWLAEDVFSQRSSPRAWSGADDPSYPDSPRGSPEPYDMADIEEVLDPEAISIGLNQISLGEDRSSNPGNSLDHDPDEQPFLRTHYLRKFLAAKAPSQLPLQCSNSPQCCLSSTPVSSSSARFFRCRECFGRRIFCAPCMVNMHQHLPFHWPEAWVDSSSARIDAEVWGRDIPLQFGYFKRTSLYDLGLQVGLGHEGSFCPSSHEADTFTMRVLHTSGQHEVRFRPCGCGQKPRWEQLLDSDIWPATELKPQTGFTLGVLRHQRCFSLRGKTSLKEYYDALVDLTSPAEHKGEIPSLYDQFRIAVRQYRILTMYMRAGKDGCLAPLQNGELCVKCPACPEPGVNLPPNWDLDRMKQLHYARFLAGDGNFKLQRLAKRGSSKSEGSKSLLGDGGFWVSESTFQRYLAETSVAADEPLNQKKSACNTMAGDPGYSPEGAKALDVTGVFAVSCRHIFLCPNGVVDFHKGEKYRYVDLCFAGPLNHSYAAGLRYFVITYDIACKYGVNFKSRCCTPTCQFVLIPMKQGELNVIFCVNKFHQESHEDGCAAKNALEYTQYVGRTCGEGVETIWAKMNWLRYSTREMSPGHRIETLSEHFNDWNWQKTLNIVRFTKSAYLSAVQSLDVVLEELESLKDSLGPATAAQLYA
ncbi:hypothetical protein FS837_003010, partial [Tulasnella sp. UAMH 9824]